MVEAPGGDIDGAAVKSAMQRMAQAQIRAAWARREAGRRQANAHALAAAPEVGAEAAPTDGAVRCIASDGTLRPPSPPGACEAAGAPGGAAPASAAAGAEHSEVAAPASHAAAPIVEAQGVRIVLGRGSPGDGGSPGASLDASLDGPAADSGAPMDVDLVDLVAAALRGGALRERSTGITAGDDLDHPHMFRLLKADGARATVAREVAPTRSLTLPHDAPPNNSLPHAPARCSPQQLAPSRSRTMLPPTTRSLTLPHDAPPHNSLLHAPARCSPQQLAPSRSRTMLPPTTRSLTLPHDAPPNNSLPHAPPPRPPTVPTRARARARAQVEQCDAALAEAMEVAPSGPGVTRLRAERAGLERRRVDMQRLFSEAASDLLVEVPASRPLPSPPHPLYRSPYGARYRTLTLPLPPCPAPSNARALSLPLYLSLPPSLPPSPPSLPPSLLSLSLSLSLSLPLFLSHTHAHNRARAFAHTHASLISASPAAQVLAARRMHLSAHLDDVATGVYRCMWHLLFTPDSDFPPVTYSVETSPAGCAAPHVRRVLSARALDTIKTGHWTMVVLEDLLFVAKPCTVAPRRAAAPRAPCAQASPLCGRSGALLTRRGARRCGRCLRWRTGAGPRA